MREDSTLPAVLEEALAAVQEELRGLAVWLSAQPDLDLATAETLTLARVRTVGAAVLAATLAVRGTGKSVAALPCPCGGAAQCEGYRPKAVQTVVGWITLRRAYYHCPGCGAGHVPLDRALGVARDSHSPGVRRLASRFGALLPFGAAATTLAEAAGVRLSASTVRTVTEAVGAHREQAVQERIARAWDEGLPVIAEAPPDRLYVAMDGVRILGTDGEGREAKVGVVVPVRSTATGEDRGAASYAAGFEPATDFGRRVAVTAHDRGLEGARQVAVLGDGAAWIWNLAAEHFPGATQIVDWYHASERVWEFGRALYGPETPETATWVERQLALLAAGRVADLVQAWRDLACSGVATAVRAEHVTYFTNQASRMAYDRYRAAGWDIGSGMVEGACKHLIGAREKGPGMRWSDAGAATVAAVRVVLFNHQWDDLWAAA